MIWYIDFTLFILMDGLILVGSDAALAWTQKRNIDLISLEKKLWGVPFTIVYLGQNLHCFHISASFLRF